MKIALMDRGINYLGLCSLVVLLSGCGAGFQAAGGIAQGRQAMFAGDNQSALSDFQSAAQADPNYIYGNELRAGVLSYVGRAQYLTGQYAQARQTLEKNLSQYPNDNLARLYLGLTLARLGDRERGLRDIEAGMKGIRDFINNIINTAPGDVAATWDPGREIRNSIDSNLAMISGAKIDWPTLIRNGESLGKRFEVEPDRAQAQQKQRLDDMNQRR